MTNIFGNSVLDGEVVSAPGFEEPIPGGTARITGNFDQDQALILATSMKNPLRTKPIIEHEDLAQDPVAHMADVYRFLGLELPHESLTEIVYSGSVGKGSHVVLSPAVEELCAELLADLDQQYRRS